MCQNIDWIKSVDKLGEYQVCINLKGLFFVVFEYLVGLLLIYLVVYFKKVGLEGFFKVLIGIGFYKVISVILGQGVMLVKNGNYFKDSLQGQFLIGNIKFVVIFDLEMCVV